MRSDRQRNRDALVAAAVEVFRADGPDGSLEEIARRAGVGSATLHRHFAGRKALLAAVYEGEISRFAAAARVDGDSELWSWLSELVRHCAADRALLEAVDPEAEVNGPGSWDELQKAAAPLVKQAKRDGRLRSDVDISDLLRLVDAVARSASGDPDRAVHLFEVIRRGSSA